MLGFFYKKRWAKKPINYIRTVRTRLELVISSVTGMRPKPTRPTDQIAGAGFEPTTSGL